MTKNNGQSVVKEIHHLRETLRVLDRSLLRLAPRLAAGAAGNGAARRTIRRKLTPKARAALILQGRYMGYMRQLKSNQKETVRRVKISKGVKAAIIAARGLSKRSVSPSR